MTDNFKTIADVNKQKRFRSNTPMLVGDEEGLFFTNYQGASEHVARRIKEDLGVVPVLELCCGIGGTTVFLAKMLQHIYAVDLNPVRIKAARKNAENFGVGDKITFLNKNALDTKMLKQAKQDHVLAVFVDVEWRSNANQNWNESTADISKTIPPITNVFAVTTKLVTKNIVLHLSPQIDHGQLQSLGECEIEEVVINGEVKMLNVYYGILRHCANSVFRI
ncbi:MAG: methyltransferase domain-containing protein [Patescibacteria group bacterium]|jgi:trimethylguanosine synthase